METRKLLIADSEAEFYAALPRMMPENYQVYTCQNGKDALALLRSVHPDVLVLDLMLPGLDGISLLQSASAAGICPMVLATTRFMSGYVMESATLLNVEYVIVKPCDLRAVAARIQDLSKRIHPAAPEPIDWDGRIVELLRAVNVPPNLDGYTYLRKAVLGRAQNPAKSLTKELYPDVGADCCVDGANVERSIRTAIASAWEHRDEENWLKYFPKSADGTLRRPTNSIFISQLACALHYPPKER